MAPCKGFVCVLELHIRTVRKPGRGKEGCVCGWTEAPKGASEGPALYRGAFDLYGLVGGALEWGGGIRERGELGLSAGKQIKLTADS